MTLQTFFAGAAHVDIDDLRTVIDIEARRLGHLLGNRRRQSAPKPVRFRPRDSRAGGFSVPHSSALG